VVKDPGVGVLAHPQLQHILHTLTALGRQSQ
jgi:hypothetical protein